MGNKFVEQNPVSFYRILCNYGSNQKELNFLIETCVKISLAHLKSIQNRIKKILEKDDLSIEDLAIDSIVRLFIIPTGVNQPAIQTAFQNWQPKIETEDDTLFFLGKVVSNRVDQYVTTLLRTSDPIFSKILTSIDYLIKKNNCKKVNYCGRVYIVKDDTDKITGTVISDEEFESLPCNLFYEMKTLLENLFGFLENETSYFLAIPINSLVNRIKRLNTQEFIYKNNYAEFSSEIETDELINSGLLQTMEKLQAGYFEKGKLTIDETDRIKKALIDMAEDLRDGGVNPGLYKYIKPYFNDLTQVEYQHKYHNILEYLLKLMKKSIGEKL